MRSPLIDANSINVTLVVTGCAFVYIFANESIARKSFETFASKAMILLNIGTKGILTARMMSQVTFIFNETVQAISFVPTIALTFE